MNERESTQSHLRSQSLGDNAACEIAPLMDPRRLPRVPIPVQAYSQPVQMMQPPHLAATPVNMGSSYTWSGGQQLPHQAMHPWQMVPLGNTDWMMQQRSLRQGMPQCSAMQGMPICSSSPMMLSTAMHRPLDRDPAAQCNMVPPWSMGQPTHLSHLYQGSIPNCGSWDHVDIPRGCSMHVGLPTESMTDNTRGGSMHMPHSALCSDTQASGPYNQHTHYQQPSQSQQTMYNPRALTRKGWTDEDDKVRALKCAVSPC